MPSTHRFLLRRSLYGCSESTIFLNAQLDASKTLHQKDLVGHFGCVNALDFSSDGKFLASGGDDRRVLLWNINKSVLGHSSSVPESGQSSNIRSSGHDNNVSCPPSAAPLSMHTQHDSNIFSLAFNPSCDKIFSAGNDQQVILHDLNTGKQLMKHQYEGAVYCVHVHPEKEELYASASEDGSLCITDVRARNGGLDGTTVSNSFYAYHSVQFHPHQPELLLAANYKEGVALWDSRHTKVALIRYGGQKCELSCMSATFCSSGRRVFAVRRRRCPVLYCVDDPIALAEFDAPTYYNSCTMKSCCFAGARDQYVVCGSDDFNLYAWRVPDVSDTSGCTLKIKAPQFTLRGHRSIVNQVRYSPGLGLLASSGVGKTVKIWSSMKLPGGCGMSDHLINRRVYSHMQYIRLIMGGDLSGQPHDYSAGNTTEDPRMLAFFDSLIQREIEGLAVMSDESETESSTDSESSADDIEESPPEVSAGGSPEKDGERTSHASRLIPSTSSGDVLEREVKDGEGASQDNSASGSNITRLDEARMHSGSIQTPTELPGRSRGSTYRFLATNLGSDGLGRESIGSRQRNYLENSNSQSGAPDMENHDDQHENPFLTLNRENLLDVLNPSESSFRHRLLMSSSNSYHPRGPRWNSRTAHRRRSRALERLANIHLNRRTRRGNNEQRFPRFIRSILTLTEVLELCSDVGIDVQEMLDENERLYVEESALQLGEDRGRVDRETEGERSSTAAGRPISWAREEQVVHGGSGAGVVDGATTRAVSSGSSVTIRESSSLSGIDSEANDVPRLVEYPGGYENSVTDSLPRAEASRDSGKNEIPLIEKSLGCESVVEGQSVSRDACIASNDQNMNESNLANSGNLVFTCVSDPTNTLQSNIGIKDRAPELTELGETEEHVGALSSISCSVPSLSVDEKKELTSSVSCSTESDETLPVCDLPSSSMCSSQEGVSNETVSNMKCKQPESSFGLDSRQALKSGQNLKRKRDPDLGKDTSAVEHDVNQNNERKILRTAESSCAKQKPEIILQSTNAGDQDDLTASSTLSNAEERSSGEAMAEVNNSSTSKEPNSETRQEIADNFEALTGESVTSGLDGERRLELLEIGGDSVSSALLIGNESRFSVADCRGNGEAVTEGCSNTTNNIETNRTGRSSQPQPSPESTSRPHSTHSGENPRRNPSSSSLRLASIVRGASSNSLRLFPPSPEPSNSALPSSDAGSPLQSYTQESPIFAPDIMSSFVGDAGNFEESNLCDPPSDEDFNITSNLLSGSSPIRSGPRRTVNNNESNTSRRSIDSAGSGSISSRRSNTARHGSSRSNSSSSSSSSNSDSDYEDNSPTFPRWRRGFSGQLQPYKEMLHLIYLKRLQVEEKKRMRRIERRLRRRAGRMAHRVYVREQRRLHTRQLLRGWRARNSEATRRLTLEHRLRERAAPAPLSALSPLSPPPARPWTVSSISSALSEFLDPLGDWNISAHAVTQSADAQRARPNSLGAGAQSADASVLSAGASVLSAPGADALSSGDDPPAGDAASNGISNATSTDATPCADASGANDPDAAGVERFARGTEVVAGVNEQSHNAVGLPTTAVDFFCDHTSNVSKSAKLTTSDANISENVSRSKLTSNLPESRVSEPSSNFTGRQADFSGSSSSVVEDTSFSTQVTSFIARNSFNFENRSPNIEGCLSLSKDRLHTTATHASNDQEGHSITVQQNKSSTDQDLAVATPSELADRLLKKANSVEDFNNKNSTIDDCIDYLGNWISTAENGNKSYDKSDSRNSFTPRSDRSDSRNQSIASEHSLVSQPNSGSSDEVYHPCTTTPIRQRDQVASINLREFSKFSKPESCNGIVSLAGLKSNFRGVAGAFSSRDVGSARTAESRASLPLNTDLSSIPVAPPLLGSVSSSSGSIHAASSPTSGTNSIYSAPGFSSREGDLVSSSPNYSEVRPSGTTANASLASGVSSVKLSMSAVPSVFELASDTASCRQRMHDAMLLEPSCSSRSKRVIAPYTLVEDSLKNSYLCRPLSSYDDSSNDSWDFGSAEARSPSDVSGRNFKHLNGQQTDREKKRFSECSSALRSKEKINSSFEYRICSSKDKSRGKEKCSRNSNFIQVHDGNDGIDNTRSSCRSAEADNRAENKDGGHGEENDGSADGGESNDDEEKEDSSIQSTVESVGIGVITCNNVVMSVTSDENGVGTDAGDSSLGCENDLESDHAPKISENSQ